MSFGKLINMEDKTILHSCLLVNHLWFEVVVRILWKNAWNFQYDMYYSYRIQHVSSPSAILNTLIACLPNDSKDLLYENRISIPTPTLKPPLFNYISFIKVLLIDTINQNIKDFLQVNTLQDLNNKKLLVLKELLKIFVSQISSLKTLKYSKEFQNIPFINFPKSENCLTNLSNLICASTFLIDYLKSVITYKI